MRPDGEVESEEEEAAERIVAPTRGSEMCAMPSDVVASGGIEGVWRSDGRDVVVSEDAAI